MKTPYKNHVLLASALNAVILLLVSYLLSNISIPISSKEYSAMQKAERWGLHGADKTWDDSVLLINTCFDFDTIPYYVYLSDTSRYTVPEGYYSISRRMDIYRILRAFSRDTTSYRYILLDIQLDSLPSHHSAYVDTLRMYTDSIVDLIVSMPRVCVARSEDFALVSDQLKAKSGMVDYCVTPMVSNFVKYSLYKDTIPTLPLKMYSDLSGRKIEKRARGLFYTDGWRLCKGSIIPTFPFRYKTSTYGWEISEKKGQKDTTYYRAESHFNLHNFCEECTDDGSVKELGENKIIVIGDLFKNDMHTTYAGKMSGALINLNTYINLAQEKHHICWPIVFCLLILYIAIFYFVLFCEKWWYKIPFWQRFWQADIVQLGISFLSWTLIFQGIALILYQWGIFYNIWLPVVWFTLVSKVYKLIILPKYEK